MSISGALNNALSGLTASGKSAQVVSSNLANMMTEGYGRREISLSSQTISNMGGVFVNGVSRIVDANTLADRRIADADYSHSSVLQDFHSRLEILVGLPGDDSSISSSVSALEESLISAASRPDSHERLLAVSRRGSEVTQSFKSASDGIQMMRQEADRNIDVMVDRLNGLLLQTRDLNQKISGAVNQGTDSSALQDQRQRIVDEISELVPVRQVDRERGGVALYTTGGAIILDGTAATLDFSRSNVVMPHMTQQSGDLSGLTINGVAVRTDSQNGAIRGGALGAQFQVRDEVAVTAQERLDGVARDLVERFQSSTVDPTLAPGAAGIFTDDGAAFAASNEVGISGRLSLNSLVDATKTNDMWRLRDGLGATSGGALGSASNLQSLADTLAEKRIASSGGFGSNSRSVPELISSLTSLIGADRLSSEQFQSFAATRRDSLISMELQDGVDSDQEMQKLLLIEKTYAANAKVIEAVDDMLNTLLRM